MDHVTLKTPAFGVLHRAYTIYSLWLMCRPNLTCLASRILKTGQGPKNLTRIRCRWQTRATRCITANVLQTNKVDAQSDKLATELSWQCFASKVANFQLPHVHLTYPTCIWRPLLAVTPFEFCRYFRRQKTIESLGCHVALFAWSDDS